ncbi:hypothetical protein SNK04_004527 [Fusarium graminearum]
MEEIEKLVSIFLNVSEAVAFIWGPIKLVLMIASSWTKSVKNILDIYNEIADALQNLVFFHNLIKRNENLKRILEDYFSDILRFHHCILNVFTKPDWARWFPWSWNKLQQDVRPIMRSLKQKQASLSEDKLQQHGILREIQDSDANARDQFDSLRSGLDKFYSSEQLRNEKLHQEEMKSTLERKLNVSLSRMASRLEQSDKVLNSYGRWILSDSVFQSWKANNSAQGDVLFLNGCPGAGKSTIARTIIRELKHGRSKDTPYPFSLFYLFFKHNDIDRQSTQCMLRHLITQIINTDETMLEFAYDKCGSVDYLGLSFLKDLALDCLLSQPGIIIILDGLDEAKDEEPQCTLEWCLNQLLKAALQRGCNVKILICAQEDGRVEPFLFSYPQIRLHAVGSHKDDIEQYCKSQSLKISERFHLCPEEQTDLIKKVADTAQGMFLYAKVVLANLASIRTKNELKAELDGKHFPRNLDEAYLVYAKVINLMQEHADMSLFCCRYLTSKPFIGIESDDAKGAVQYGYFGFVDYAAVFYRSHVDRAESLKSETGSASTIYDAKDALSDLRKAYLSPSDEMAEMDAASEQPAASEESNKLVDQAIEHKMPTNANFKYLHGPVRYKCPKIHCQKFFDGFSSNAELEKHAARHDRPFRCIYKYCASHTIGFASQKDLQKHNRTDHNEDSQTKVVFPVDEKTKRPTFLDACRAGDLDKVKILYALEDKLRHNSPGISPLTVALEAGHVHICKYLIGKGVSPLGGLYKTESTRQSPIHFAIHRNDTQMLQLLLISNSEITDNPNHSHLAKCVLGVLRNYPDGLQAIIRLSASKRSTALSIILESVVAEQLVSLFDIWGRFGGSLSNRRVATDHSTDATAMHTSFRQLFPNLYDQNATFSPDKNFQEYKIYQQALEKQSSILHDAFRCDNYPFATFLMEIDKNGLLKAETTAGNSILHSFMKESCEMECDGCIIMARRLVEVYGGEFANRPNHDDELLVHIALSRELSPAALQVLLEVSQDLNRKNKNGKSPLHYVHSAEIMNIILQHKDIDLFSRNKEGQTYFAKLCEASEHSSEGHLRLLLAADIKLAWATDDSATRLTPLHHAMQASGWSHTNPSKWGDSEPSGAANILLNLPEVKDILQAYSACSVKDCEKVRDFARKKKLNNALEVMNKIGFGLPVIQKTNG